MAAIVRGCTSHPVCMRRSDRRPSIIRILCFTILTILQLGTSANAVDQGPPALARLEVALWPEYDRSKVLVMLRGWLAPGVSLPATVSLPIPAQVGKPHAVAKRGADRRLLVAPHTLDLGGESARVLLVTDMPEIRLEYYLDLKITDSQRQLLFEWPGGLEIQQLDFEVMQPVGSSELTITPAAAHHRIGRDGLTYHLGELGPIGAEEAFTIAATYTKESSELTASELPPLPGVPPSFASEPSGSASPPVDIDDGGWPIPWLMVFVVFVIGVGTGAWMFRSIKIPRRGE